MRDIALETKILKLLDLDLKNGLLKGNKIQKYLSEHLGEITFDELKIPISIVATDINTGEKVVFREGRVLDAIRASIGIPGVFTPYKHNNRHLVDGGIIENLPVQSLQHPHAVIAVSVLMDARKHVKVKKSFFFPNGHILSNGYGMIRKTINIMMAQNELGSIRSRESILVISPERDDIDYYNFNKMNLMIDEGYRVSVVLGDFFKQN